MLFFQQEFRCPFCKATLSGNATKCYECNAIKDFTRYNILAIFLFGFCGSLVFPAILYFFAEVSIHLSTDNNDSNVSLSIVILLSLVCVLFLISKLPCLKGKWVRET